LLPLLELGTASISNVEEFMEGMTNWSWIGVEAIVTHVRRDRKMLELFLFCHYVKAQEEIDIKIQPTAKRDFSLHRPMCCL
jgi:hypothetical protein